jgi:hypothetical protein
MSKEEGLFTVSEGEKLEEELISVAEETAEYQMSFQGISDEQEVRENVPAKQEPQGWLQTKKVEQFVQFLDEQMSKIPTVQHAQGNLSKMENAAARWKKLNNYCSEAMRGDFDGVLNVDEIDKKRQQVEYNMDALQDAIDSLHTMKQTRKQQRRKHRRADEDFDETMTKEATAPHFNGFQMVVTPFQRAIVGALINGKVSGGRNIEELWTEAKKKYNMDAREELEILQVLADFGHPEFKDRLRLGDDEDPSRKEGFGEWTSNYYA